MEDGDGIFLFSGSCAAAIVEEETEDIHFEKLKTLKEKLEAVIVEFGKDMTHNMLILPPLDKKDYKKYSDDFRLGDNSEQAKKRKRLQKSKSRKKRKKEQTAL